MNIVLIGTGNVAATLGRLLVKSGHTVLEVVGRDADKRNKLATALHAKAGREVSKIKAEADICILAVSDKAIAEVAEQLNADKMLVVHTSGATSKEVLNRFENYGVLYPLQSLREGMTQLPPIPFFIDANAKKNIDLLNQLASSTGNEVKMADDEQRLKLHVAAVLCSNFTNHLYALTEAFCNTENIDFKSLLPLIQETAERLQHFPAAQMQTGPAIRHDKNTLEHHLEVLLSYPHISHLYQILTESIQRFS